MRTLEKGCAPHFRAKNAERSMRYFMPEWDDRVCPIYNFNIGSSPSGKHDSYDKVYAHEIYEPPNYDGLLFSRVAVEMGSKKRAQIEARGIHNYARFSRPILGDCGAFGYVTATFPPYETDEMLSYYQKHGFDYGVSIDHLILPAFSALKEERYRVTRENARAFLEGHRRGNYQFVPIGVAQGWSPASYQYAVAELREWGYQYIALGGLARTPTVKIIEVLEFVAPLLHHETDLHLFGVFRPSAIMEFRRLGVTSFDAASPLRQAWLDSTKNYHALDGQRYSALRVLPVSPSHPKVKQLISRGVSLAYLQRVERQALLALREYDKGRLCVEEVLQALVALDPEGAEARLSCYQTTLIEQPWKYCPCLLCSDLGIDILVFRGNERNRRRGFHNTYVFYHQLQALLQR